MPTKEEEDEEEEEETHELYRVANSIGTITVLIKTVPSERIVIVTILSFWL